MRPPSRRGRDRAHVRPAGAVHLHPQRRPQHRVTASSAGTDPADQLNSTVVTALGERGISLAGVRPRTVTAELLADADLVVTMSRQPTGPTLPGPASIRRHWQLPFPDNDLEAMRAVCDDVDQRVAALPY
jgi:arsenate reductase (thioredoxin)